MSKKTMISYMFFSRCVSRFPSKSVKRIQKVEILWAKQNISGSYVLLQRDLPNCVLPQFAAFFVEIRLQKICRKRKTFLHGGKMVFEIKGKKGVAFWQDAL